MKIRSITLFCSEHPRNLPVDAVELLHRARERAVADGLEVQTIRLAGGDPLALLPAANDGRDEAWLELGDSYEEACDRHGIDYVSAGAFACDEALVENVPAMLARTRRVFAAAHLNDARGVDLQSVRRIARVVSENAAIEADGFANLRFAALANVGVGVPFLPAAHHGSGGACFAIAVECADLFVEAVGDARDLGNARAGLISRLEDAAARIETCVRGLEAARWLGMDFSPAPFPTEDCSLIAAMEGLGLPRAGVMGSVAVAAFLASALDAADFRRSGFNGLFFPVLEDSRLAARTGRGEVGLKDLLLWSTVCGTGLDTVPLAGSIGEGELAAILLEIAALGQRLSKPLTARLMPMPQKSAGDALRFDFPYFADGAVMDHGAMPLGGPLAEAAHLPIDARSARSPN